MSVGDLQDLNDRTAAGFAAVGDDIAALKLRVYPLRCVVQPDKTILGGDGQRFVVKGATMFDYLFSSFEPRTNWSYRKIYQPAGKGPGTGISEPTYYAPYVYVSAANVKAQIKRFRDMGGNLIRVSIEPASALASVPYVDPGDGLTYPSDLDMLDVVIEAARSLGVIVYLTMNNEQQFSGDGVASPTMIAFLQILVARYSAYDNIWLCPANEMNSTSIQSSGGAFSVNPGVSNAATWITKAAGYVAAIRAAGFSGPIGLNPTEFGYNLSLVAAGILANATLANDPNLIIDTHQYSTGTTDFYNDAGSSGLPDTLVKWANYAGQFCLIVGETGINNNLAGGANLDPNLNGASADPALWAKLQVWMQQYLDYANHFSEEKLSGVIGHMWRGYIPGLAKYDNNAMQKNDGVLTTWGTIFRDYFLSPVLGWVAWTPAPTPGAGAFGSFTATGRKKQVGKSVSVEMFLSIPTIGTATGPLACPLPTPQKEETVIHGADVVGGFATYWIARKSGGTLIQRYDNTTLPALGNGHAYVFQGQYETK